MQKTLLLAALCLAGLVSCKPKKEVLESESVRICKALVEITVRQSACGIGEPDWQGASREEQEQSIEEMFPYCKNEAFWREEEECELLNLPVLEKFAKALRGAGDCEAVQAMADPPDWCLDESNADSNT